MADLDAPPDANPKKLYKRIIDGAQLRAAIFALYNDRTTSDVTLDVAARRWHLHGGILCAWSGAWREEFGQGKRAFKLANADADIVDDMIRYFYSGELVLTSHNASPLLSLASSLRVGAFFFWG